MRLSQCSGSAHRAGTSPSTGLWPCLCSRSLTPLCKHRLPTPQRGAAVQTNQLQQRDLLLQYF